MRERSLILTGGALALTLAGTALLWTGATPATEARASAEPAGASAPVDRTAQFHRDVTPLLQRFCYECHGDGASAGDLELDAFETLAEVTEAKETWEKVIRYARTHVMPPPDADEQPTQEERDQLTDHLLRYVYNVDAENPDPGKVTIRRLNRVEYRNTIRDLTGVDFDATIEFPEDDTGYGFDNVADVLTLPPMLMEKYLAAAEKILEQAIPGDQAQRRDRRVPAAQARFGGRGEERRREGRRPPADDAGWVTLASREEDALSVALESPAPADYVLRVLAYARRSDDVPADRPVTLSLMNGDAVVRDVEIAADEANPQWYEARIGVPSGRSALRAAVRRQRGIEHDRIVHAGRVGPEQPGVVRVKEIVIDGPVQGAVRRTPGDRLQLSGNANLNSGAAALYVTGDEAATQFDVPADGEYLLRAQASADFAGDEPTRMELLLDGQPLKTFDVTAPAQFKSGPSVDLAPGAARAVPQVYEVRTELKTGKRKLSLRFVNNFKQPEHENPHYRDRNLYLQHLEVVDLSADPLSPPMTPPLRTTFAKHVKETRGGDDRHAARAVLIDFTRRAWRRPPADEEIDRLMALYDLAREHGESLHGGVKHAIKAVLVSSSFLFRGEIDEPFGGGDRPIVPVSEYELATRLSYFLWSSTPDDELLDVAERGELRKNLGAQVKRLLDSPKSQALVENFAGQWLQFRNLDAVHPDRLKFDAYDDRLRDAMQKETQLFFEAIVREDRSVMDVLTADYTFVNERLAKHYGIADVKGEAFRRVSLEGLPRRGVLTHGSVLTLTSNPTRTSPVKRGKWVLENLLGTAPPPPPDGAVELTAENATVGGTLRQQLERHREDPTCASCHAPMDPIGFALENFDPIGAWRETDGKDPIDAKSSFVNGPEFEGPIELAKLLAQTRRRDFFRSITESAMTFALGRGVEPFDQPAIDQVVKSLNESDGRFSSLVLGVVQSVPFQMRRAGNAQERDAVGG